MLSRFVKAARDVRRLGFTVVALIAAMAFLAPSALARVSTSDAAATHAYLKAVIALNHASGEAAPAGIKAIEALATQVQSECPDVLAGAPPHVKGEKTNKSRSEAVEEIAAATFGVAEHLEHPAHSRFASAVKRLHWSNPRLTRLLRSLAREQADQSAIPAPELCPDMKFWVASGFTATSTGTHGLLHRLQVVSSITQIEVEPHEPPGNAFNLTALVAYRLKPYEDQRDRALARKALPPESSLTPPQVKPYLEALAKVEAALGYALSG